MVPVAAPFAWRVATCVYWLLLLAALLLFGPLRMVGCCADEF